MKQFRNSTFEGFLGFFLVPEQRTETTISILNRGYLNKELVTQVFEGEGQKESLQKPNINNSEENSCLVARDWE